MICFTVYNTDGELVQDIIHKIKSGDSQLREKFIRDYIPFILKVVSKSVHGKSNLKNSDEYSIGLIAFNEAIEKYDRSKCEHAFNFFSFAEQIIKRRIIDYIRFVSKSNNEIPFSYFKESPGSVEEEYLKDQTVHSFDRMELFQEIKHFDKVLSAFGLKVSELHKYTPKHKDSREMCVEVAKKIAGNKEIYQKIISKKYFPMKDLTKIVSVHPRTIERNREYIISISLVYGNGYEHLQSYLGSNGYKE